MTRASSMQLTSYTCGPVVQLRSLRGQLQDMQHATERLQSDMCTAQERSRDAERELQASRADCKHARQALQERDATVADQATRIASLLASQQALQEQHTELAQLLRESHSAVRFSAPAALLMRCCLPV